MKESTPRSRLPLILLLMMCLGLTACASSREDGPGGGPHVGYGGSGATIGVGVNF